MRPRGSKKRFVSILLVFCMLIGLTAVFNAQAQAEDPVRYVYLLKSTGGDGSTDGILTLDLFITIQGGMENDTTVPGPLLDAGAFGLKIPDWAESASFALATAGTRDAVTIVPMVPEARYNVSGYQNGGQLIQQNSYMAFAWRNVSDADGAYQNWTWLSAGHSIQHWGLKLGTFTITLPQLEPGKYRCPGAGDVGQLDWMRAQEAIPLEVDPAATVSDPTDKLNKTIWNPETGLYQGYYNDDDPALPPEQAIERQTDIGFSFTPPDSWIRYLSVISYAPVKGDNVTWEIYDGTTLAGESKVDPIAWDPAVKDTAILRAVNAKYKDTGMGAYHTPMVLGTESEINYHQAIRPGQTYTLKVSKPGHLTVAIPVTITTQNCLADAILPTEADDGEIYLPVGDINPVRTNSEEESTPKFTYGDGVIDNLDRAALLSVMGSKRVDNQRDLVYYADLDGDGFVTMEDLSILMSPQNYGHHSD